MKPKGVNKKMNLASDSVAFSPLSLLSVNCKSDEEKYFFLFFIFIYSKDLISLFMPLIKPSPVNFLQLRSIIEILSKAINII